MGRKINAEKTKLPWLLNVETESDFKETLSYEEVEKFHGT